MPVGFNSPARNFFLLGSTGSGVVGNFFDTIDRSAGTDGVFLPDEIRYNYTDQKYLLAGSASDNASKGFGWFEKRDEAGTADFDVRVEAGAGVNTTLRAMELDYNNNLIVVGKSGNAPWIAKYSNAGVIDWQATTFSADVEYTGITADTNDIYYTCGNTPTSGFAQAFVEKYSNTGTPDWGKSAFMLGRDVVLNAIDCNSRGEVVAVGFLEDNVYNKGYIVKLDTTTGDVMWDRTLSPDAAGDMLNCTDVYIDSEDQIYVSVNGTDDGYLVKYTPEGNIQWQRKTAQSSGSITYDQVFSDGETQQTVVFGTYTDSGDTSGLLTKYSRNGDLVWRRTLTSSFNNSDTFANVCLDGDPSFYYFMYIDGIVSGLNGTPDAYTFGKVSSSGNGLGDFQYTEGTGETIDYVILAEPDKIGRLSDGSVRHDTSDLIAYPFGATKIMFDDLAAKVTNKKRQMDDADSFEYSGSPAIRPTDFQGLNLLGDTGIVAGTTTTPDIGTIQFGFDNSDNTFDTSSTSVSYNSSGLTFNTWSGSQLMSGLGGLGANSVQVWKSSNLVEVQWTISTDTTDRYIFTSSDGQNWTSPGSLYDTDTTPATVTSKYLATGAGANVSTVTVSGVATSTTGPGTWQDQSGKGNDGVVYGVTHNANGYWEFDGTDDYMSGNTTPLANTTEGTIEAWIKTTSTANPGGHIYGESLPGTFTYWAHFRLNGSVLHFVVDDDDVVAQADGSSTVNDGNWHHVAITGDGSNWTFYVDGVAETPTFDRGDGTKWFNDAPGLTHYSIGALDRGTRGNFFDGEIGEVRVYPRALTGAAVFQNYNATKETYTGVAASTNPGLTSTRTP